MRETDLCRWVSSFDAVDSKKHSAQTPAETLDCRRRPHHHRHFATTAGRCWHHRQCNVFLSHECSLKQDEPTNHLDGAAVASLCAGLREHGGAAAGRGLFAFQGTGFESLGFEEVSGQGSRSLSGIHRLSRGVWLHLHRIDGSEASSCFHTERHTHTHQLKAEGVEWRRGGGVSCLNEGKSKTTRSHTATLDSGAAGGVRAAPTLEHAGGAHAETRDTRGTFRQR